MPIPSSVRRFRRSLFALACLPAFAAGAAADYAGDAAGGATGTPPPLPCTGLVLGGGGARGAAHIGVLRELERQRVPICAIAGTSMGAIVGALYASGRTPDQIESILARLDWADLFRDEPPRPRLPMRRKDAQLNYRLELEAGWRDGGPVLPYGAVQGQKLGLLLQSLFDGAPADFDRLPIPFRAVATDIVEGSAVIPASGSLADVVRASMAVPAVFAPMEIDGRLLVDGGLSNNVPVSVVRALGADRVIAVDVGSPLFSREQLRTPADVAFQMVSVLMKERTDRELALLGEGDVLLSPELGEFSAADFAGASSVIATGEAAARTAASALASFSTTKDAWHAWRASTRLMADGGRQIAFVEVDDARSTTAELVRRRTAELQGKALDVATIEPAVSAAYAEGTYERIAWRTEQRDGRSGIVLTPVDKPWGPVFANIGMQFSDDFNGRSDYQIVSELLVTGLSEKGDELRSLLKLGRVTELSADWFAPLNVDRDYYAGVDAGWRAQDLPIALDGRQVAEYRLSRAHLGARLGLQRNPRWSLESGLWLGRHEADPSIATDGFPRVTADTRAWGARAAWDTLDRLSFPSSGGRFVLMAQHYPGGWNDDGDGSVLRVRGDWAFSSGPHHWLLGGRWASTWGDPPGLAAYSTLGGFLNLSGKVERSLVEPHLALGRVVYYARLGESRGLFSAPPFVGVSLEAGNAWPTREAMSFGDLISANGAFVGISSPFGPLLLGYGRSSDGDRSWTLSFGNLIRSDDQ
jgi:NTE family protein